MCIKSNKYYAKAAQNLFRSVLQKQMLVLDGAMGTMVQRCDLNANDFGGQNYEGCIEYLNLTRPDIILNIHKQYINAGADIIETNSFGSSKIVLDDYGLGEKDEEINKASAKLARKAILETGGQVFVAGAIGPTTKSLSITSNVTFEQMTESYFRQAKSLIAGGVDALTFETIHDTRNAKAGIIGIKKAFREMKKEVPLMISITIDNSGMTLSGQTIEGFYLAIEHANPVSVGINCTEHSDRMESYIRELHEICKTNISYCPNAGIPDEFGIYKQSPQTYAQSVKSLLEKGYINILGGCCGTTPEHIKSLKKMIYGLPKRNINENRNCGVSGLSALIYEKQQKPILIGETTNVCGSRVFKKLIESKKFDEAIEMAKAQIKNDAKVIDVCLSNPESNELQDMTCFMEKASNLIKATIMVNSRNLEVVESALRHSQGKAIINSINLESGEANFEKAVKLMKEYGAAIVVGTIDESGMALKSEKKLSIAQRSYKLLTEKYEVNEQDIIFDPLVFPVNAENKNNAAQETIKAIKLIKKTMPNTKTLIGVSNISFGLPSNERDVLNTVYLHECTKAGLDFAIVNTEKLQNYESTEKEKVELCTKLIYESSKENVLEFTEYFRKEKIELDETENLNIEQRLENHIVKGTKTGLIEDLDIALEEGHTALKIVNEFLINGMDKVSQLFKEGKLIVAEILQSAEVMRESVSYLEKYMPYPNSSKRGKIMLATVKGDVHDIGKNLVEIIMSNNGYEVVDIGTNVSNEQIIEKVKSEKPDIIGLSGLLVNSAYQMVTLMEDLKTNDIEIPIMVGGAAVTEKFTAEKISANYDGVVKHAEDAMSSLEIAKLLIDKKEIQKIRKEWRVDLKKKSRKISKCVIKPSSIEEAETCVPNSLQKIEITNIGVKDLLPFLNEQILYCHHLGLKGNYKQMLEAKDSKAIKLTRKVNEVLQCVSEWSEPKAVYKFFKAQSSGNSIIVHDGTSNGLSFEFPRQETGECLCLSDFVRNISSDQVDYIGLFAATFGSKYVSYANQCKYQGDYLKSHIVISIAMTLAEALAEKTHREMINQGERFSFGYSCCPNLSEQAKLFTLLKPEEIGIRLTLGHMMHPEASVSGIVLGHPKAKFFSCKKS